MSKRANKEQSGRVTNGVTNFNTVKLIEKAEKRGGEDK